MIKYFINHLRGTGLRGRQMPRSSTVSCKNKVAKLGEES